MLRLNPDFTCTCPLRYTITDQPLEISYHLIYLFYFIFSAKLG